MLFNKIYDVMNTMKDLQQAHTVKEKWFKCELFQLNGN